MVGEVHRTEGSTRASPSGRAWLAVDLEAVGEFHTHPPERPFGRAEDGSEFLLPELVAGRLGGSCLEKRVPCGVCVTQSLTAKPRISQT